MNKKEQSIHDHELAISYAGDGSYVLMMRKGKTQKKEDGIYQKYIVLMTSSSPSSLVQEAQLAYENKKLYIPEMIEVIMDIEIKHYMMEISDILNKFEKDYNDTDQN